MSTYDDTQLPVAQFNSRYDSIRHHVTLSASVFPPRCAVLYVTLSTTCGVSGRNSFRNPQPCRAACRIPGNLRERGRDALSPQELDGSGVITCAHRLGGRAEAVPGFLMKEPLYDAILQALVTDDRQTPPGRQQLQCLREGRLQGLEICIDDDAKGHEGLRRRVYPRCAALPHCEIDAFNELACRFKWTTPNDRPGDSPSGPRVLIAVCHKEVD